MNATSILSEDDRAEVISLLAGDTGVQLSVVSLDEFIDAPTQRQIAEIGAYDTAVHEWLLDLLVKELLLSRTRWPAYGDDTSDAEHDQFLLDLRAAATARGWVVREVWPVTDGR